MVLTDRQRTELHAGIYEYLCSRPELQAVAQQMQMVYPELAERYTSNGTGTGTGTGNSTNTNTSNGTSSINGAISGNANGATSAAAVLQSQSTTLLQVIYL
jgi:hypothetical protein